MPRSVSFTILGVIASMKNSRRPSDRNLYVTLKSRGCEAFERDFRAQLPGRACIALGSLTQPLKATVKVFYRDYRSDVDVEFLFDLMQKYGVVVNDRYIRWKDVCGVEVDKLNPRVEVTVEEL